jgi:hypothetical protein
MLDYMATGRLIAERLNSRLLRPANSDTVHSLPGCRDTSVVRGQYRASAQLMVRNTPLAMLSERCNGLTIGLSVSS